MRHRACTLQCKEQYNPLHKSKFHGQIGVCGKCVAMPTVRESICCCVIERVELKMNENENSVCCITEHEGFHQFA